MGVSLAAIHHMPIDEYVRWRAFFVWRRAARGHAADVANMRARR